MDRFVPGPVHINALPGPLRKYIHDLATRADPTGDVAEIAMLRENNAGPMKTRSGTGIPGAAAEPLRFCFTYAVVPQLCICRVFPM